MWRAATPAQRSRPQREGAERAGSRARRSPGRLAGGAAIVALALAGAACSSGDLDTENAPADAAAAATPTVATSPPAETPADDGPRSGSRAGLSAAASSPAPSTGGQVAEPAPPASSASAGAVAPGQTPLKYRSDADPAADPGSAADAGSGSDATSGTGDGSGTGAASGPGDGPSLAPAPRAGPGTAPEAAATSPAAGADPTATPSPTAGEPFDLPYPSGTSLAVVGVRYDDVLFVRRGPGPDFGVVETLGPSAEGVVTSGRGWLPAAGGAWAEVSADGVPGWANLRFLALRDGTLDITADLIEQQGGPLVAESMVALGRLVAQGDASADPPPSVVLSSRPVPAAGDLHEVGYDVVGLADDSVRAVRLRVVGRAVEGGLSYELVTAESTAYCARGAGAPGGTCV